MSENITHVAVCDDVVRLASRHPGIPPEFNAVLGAHLDLARLGAATRSADRWSAEIVHWVREKWTDGAVGDGRSAGNRRGMRVREKLAYVLGALTHRAADRLFKPIFEYCRQQYGPEAGLDCSIHCDVLVFREVYGGGQGGAEAAVDGSKLPTALANPYQRAVFQAPASEAGRAAEAYFRVLWQRALIGMHTFSPDRDDMLGWLDRLFDHLQGFNIDLDRYQQVVEQPDPDRFTRYLEDTHCYDGDDPLIQVARRIQRGEEVPGARVEKALVATDERSSRYAQALQKGLRYLLAAGQVWRREIDVAAAKTAFDVGVPEHSLVFEPAEQRA